MFDAIGQLFQSFINFLQPILIPDWKALIDLLPVLLLIGVVGPILTLLIFGWFLYVVGKPRSRIPYVDPQPELARIVDELAVDVFAFGILTDFRTKLFPGSQRLVELVADRVARIEARQRILEDHGDLGAADAVELGVAQADQFLIPVAH